MTKQLLLTIIAASCVTAMEKNISLSTAIELHPEICAYHSIEDASRVVSHMSYGNEDYSIVEKKVCNQYENYSQNWYADISDNYTAKKKLYKESLYMMPSIIKDHSCPVTKFFIDGPNTGNTTVTYIESHGMHGINVFNKYANTGPVTYGGTVLSMALSADTKLAISGPHAKGFYFTVYDIIFKPDKPLFGKKRELPQLVDSSISYSSDMGLLFKKMTFMNHDTLWCIDLKNKLRKVTLNYSKNCVIANQAIPLPLGKNQRVNFFASDPASRQHFVLVDNYADVYTGIVLKQNYILKKLRTLSSIIATLKEEDRARACCLREVRLANKKCFFIFNISDTNKTAQSHLPSKQIVCKFDLNFTPKSGGLFTDSQLFVMPFTQNNE